MPTYMESVRSWLRACLSTAARTCGLITGSPIGPVSTAWDSYILIFFCLCPSMWSSLIALTFSRSAAMTVAPVAIAQYNRPVTFGAARDFLPAFVRAGFTASSNLQHLPLAAFLHPST